MFYSASVPVPEQDDRIQIREVKGNSYVYFPFFTDDGDGKGGHILKVIGKLDPDNPERMFPNENYILFLWDDTEEEEDLPDEKKHDFYPEEFKETEDDYFIPEDELPPLKSPSVVRVGEFLVIEQIVKQLHLDRILIRVLGANARLFLDLAAFWLITEILPSKPFRRYLSEYALFSFDLYTAPDLMVSRLFKEVGYEESQEFLKFWTRKRNRDAELIVTLCTADRDVVSKNVSFTGTDTASDDKRRIFDFFLAFEADTLTPVLYEINTRYMDGTDAAEENADALADYGYSNITFLCERGSFSLEDIEFLDQNGWGFLIPMEADREPAHSVISRARGTFEKDPGCWIEKFQLAATEVTAPLCKEDKRKRYFYVCYDPALALELRNALQENLDASERFFSSQIGKDFHPTKESKEHFLFHYDAEGRLLSFTRREDVIQEENDFAGYSVLISSKTRNAEDALSISRGCTENELLFALMRDYTQIDLKKDPHIEVEETEMFLSFTALLIRQAVESRLQAAADRIGKQHPEYLTLFSAKRNLEGIQILRDERKKYKLANDLTPRQIHLLSIFGITPEMAERRAMILGEEIRLRI